MGNASAISGRTFMLRIENTAMAPARLSSKDIRLSVGSDRGGGGGIGGPLPRADLQDLTPPSPGGPKGRHSLTDRSKQGTSTPEEQDSRGKGTTLPSTPLPAMALKSDQLQERVSPGWAEAAHAGTRERRKGWQL